MKNLNLLPLALPAALLSVSSTVSAKPKKHKATQMNVLVFIMDDLRPELNCYGDSTMITPNLDKLAQSGVQFNRAYCNVPVSGASRASFFTGMRPTVSRFLNVDAEIQDDAPGVLTLPKYLKQNGYVTYSNSKTIHGANDCLDSWTEKWYPEVPGKTWRNYLSTENMAGDGKPHGATAYECIDVADDAYIDGMTANKTIEQLKALKKSGKPFFIATGILKPHLPFNAPKKYWDLYDFNKIQLPDNYNMDRSTFPDKAFHTWGELRNYKNIPDQGKIQDDAEARRLIHGYKACVSYADAQVGKIMDELKTLGLDKNTIVVLYGDHGWSLGEHGLWCKHSNFEVANHTPLMVAGPGIPKNKKVDKIVELVDVYPTVCKMIGLPIPSNVEGVDMTKLVQKEDDSWKNYAVIKWQTGLSYVTPDYHYTEWVDKKDNIQDRVLFDMHKDYDQNVNLARSAEYAQKMDELSKQLHQNRGVDYLKPSEKKPVQSEKAKGAKGGQKKKQ